MAGFDHQADAQQFLTDLPERLAKFSLELRPDKTRLIGFGRNAARIRASRGVGKPETFDFLGFTHFCGKTKNGRFWLKRKTISKRMRAKLAKVKDQLRRRMHPPIPKQGRWLASVVRGHPAYDAVPGNTDTLASFRTQVTRLWSKALWRRSQRNRLNWARLNRTVTRWLPPKRVQHPFLNVRFDAITRGRSSVRKRCTLGSVRGAAREGGLYRDPTSLAGFGWMFPAEANGPSPGWLVSALSFRIPPSDLIRPGRAIKSNFRKEKEWITKT